MIAKFSFANPILIGEGDVIIAVHGHGRLMAARSLGLAQVGMIVLNPLSATQRRDLILAKNRIAENARWDNAMQMRQFHGRPKISLAGRQRDHDSIENNDARTDHHRLATAFSVPR